MKQSKITRRTNALARFRVLPFNEWRDAKFPARVGEVSPELLELHTEYCARKALEKQSLERNG